MKPRTVIAVFLLSLIAGYFLATQLDIERKTDTPANDIRLTLEAWPRAFNDKDLDKTCALFAPDVVLCYPGVPDRDYKKMRAGFEKLFSDIDKNLRYDRPRIDSIQVSGNLAAVRLIWTLHARSDKGDEVTREQGIDVFRRQSDGGWKIIMSHAYPLKDD